MDDERASAGSLRSNRPRRTSIPIPFDAGPARAFGQVAASLRRWGRTRAARAYDALIAVTAIANGLPLYSCNPGDFAGTDGLVIHEVAVLR